MPILSDIAPAKAIVCVPARNESERIGRLLASLAAQSVASEATPLKVVVASNNSTDGTVEVTRRFAHDARLNIKLLDVVLPPEMAHAGTARRLAMDAGSDWFEADAILDGVLISTDADAVAPTSWVASNLAALSRADLVGGRLVIARDQGASAALTDLHARIERYWSAVRALEDQLDPPEHDPAPRHGDHTGASLALRASLYRTVGGVPTIPNGEDNALVAAVAHVGGRVRHCPDVSIQVSAREIGRADGGMALEMVRRRETLAGAAPYLLPSAASWRARLERRARWRAEWLAVDDESPNAIAYVARREAGARSKPSDHMPVDEGIAELEALAATLSRAIA
jgi:hypothetical protein